MVGERFVGRWAFQFLLNRASLSFGNWKRWCFHFTLWRLLSVISKVKCSRVNRLFPFYIALTRCQQFHSYQIIYYSEKIPWQTQRLIYCWWATQEIFLLLPIIERCLQFRPGLLLWFCMKYKHLRKENQSEILTWFQIKTKSPCTVKILGFLYRKDSSCREKIRVPSKQVAFG